ncbi:MAG: putative DNA binding domain-containing protein [Candidatus Moranbacteria bacterium]|nr:putative DNA binding domain-containing protein [Candidatus Moranbacteria bacterium]
MKIWEKEAEDLLSKSLNPFPQELNEIDWKLGLSEKTDRLAQHISAFANNVSGGFLVFGIDNGSVVGITSDECEQIVKTLGNIARQNLMPPVILDHNPVEYQGENLLFVKIDEASDKPIHLRNGSIYDSYVRSAGQTRKAEKSEVANLIARSQGLRFEDGIAKTSLSSEDVLKIIDFSSYFDLTGRPMPDGNDAILDVLCSEKLTRKNGNTFDITNLGAILFAKDIEQFEGLNRKAVRVIIYGGKDRLKTLKELDGKKGYASGFESLISFITNLLPANEVIKAALRTDVKMYPVIAIRELVANALIHQDFSIIGSGPMIEIFSDRIEISNPGQPLIDTLRLLDSPPQSRNEKLASIMRRFKVCEERGSGIDKVVSQTEVYQLPAPDFVKTENHFRATLFAHKTFSEMTKDDRVRACYLHCCLKYVAGKERINNATVRERFQISEQNYPIASGIISDTIEAGLILTFDPDSNSKRYKSYIPFWAR